jgi:hypothetical protein
MVLYLGGLDAMRDYAHRTPEAIGARTGWLRSGRLKALPVD